MKFKSYMINEAKKRGEATPLDIKNPAVEYCYVEVMQDMNQTKKGMYRFISGTTSGQIATLELAPMTIKKSRRTQGRTVYQKLDKSLLGDSEFIRRVSTFNNADALERTVIFAAEYFFEFQKNISINEMKELVDNYPNARISEGFRRDIYDNAIRSIKEVKKIISPSKTYSYERQGENYSKPLYKLAKTYNKMGKSDNWNPGDIWLFSQAGIAKLQKIDEFIENYVESLHINHNLFESKEKDNERGLALNYFIAQGVQSKDILPISLKKPTHNGPLTATLLNKFDVANLPVIEELGKLEITKITGGSLSFRSMEIQTNHYKKLALKFQVTDSADKSTNFQHRVRNNLAGHAEGSYLSTPDWKVYLAKHNIKMYGAQPGYLVIPEDRKPMLTLFLNTYKEMSKASLLDKKTLNKMGDPEIWFDKFYNNNKTNNMNYIKRFIFIGSWIKAVNTHGSEMVRTAMSIAMKTDHNRAGSSPHYIIK